MTFLFASKRRSKIIHSEQKPFKFCNRRYPNLFSAVNIFDVIDRLISTSNIPTKGTNSLLLNVISNYAEIDYARELIKRSLITLFVPIHYNILLLHNLQITAIPI